MMYFTLHHTMMYFTLHHTMMYFTLHHTKQHTDLHSAPLLEPSLTSAALVRQVVHLPTLPHCPDVPQSSAHVLHMDSVHA